MKDRTSQPSMLVFGAAEDSIGEAVAHEAAAQGMTVTTVGISGHEDEYVNVSHGPSLHTVIKKYKPDHIFVTIGINDPSPTMCVDEEMLSQKLQHSFWVNACLPLLIAQEWHLQLKDVARDVTRRRTFSAVSSNSAHIARRSSLAYCASKSALSMGLRVMARELAGSPFLVFGYEPGLVRGTRMSQETEATFGPAATRMPGASAGLHVADVADQIVALVCTASLASNGILYRMDAGEQ